MRHPFRSVHLLLVAALAAAPALAGQTSTLTAPAAARIDRIVAAEQARQKIPGLSIAVAVGNEPVYSKSYGHSDLEHGVPVKVTTAFRTASVAKPLTATGVMALVETGQIVLDAPIRTYCAAWPDKHPPITVRQVLGHLAGIRHYTKPGESTGTKHYFELQSALTLFKNDPLVHEPGTKYLYSTYGYTLLGCAIEGASGTTYEQQMRDHVFSRAGMSRTRLDRIYEIVPDRARGYQVLTKQMFDQLPPVVAGFARPGEVYNADLHDTSMKVPGGGLLSTADDLVRFGIAMNTGRLLKRSTVEEMWTELKTADGKGTGYGLGFGVTVSEDGTRRLSHNGNQAGASSTLVILPDAGVTYAIMTNLEDADLGAISRGIADTLRETLMRSQR